MEVTIAHNAFATWIFLFILFRILFLLLQTIYSVLTE